MNLKLKELALTDFHVVWADLDGRDSSQLCYAGHVPAVQRRGLRLAAVSGTLNVKCKTLSVNIAKSSLGVSGAFLCTLRRSATH